ncbi:MAG TPA: lactate utilization protein C [Mycobacteriales bacterium]|jgi:L-lactate dehydrogenase complex protein LldG
MSAREEVLRRIRTALADVPPGDQVPVPRAYLRELPSGVDVLDLFAERVADYRATVRHVTAAELPEAVAAALGSGRRIVVPPDVPDGWLSAVDAEVVRDDGTLTAPDLDTMDGVLTGAAVGIAETGTIVLDGGAAQGRRALSLVPDLHVCVVRTDQVVGTVPEGVALVDAVRTLTWISGPSATSDIELRRVEGVHGPRTLVVLLLG